MSETATYDNKSQLLHQVGTSRQ